MVVGTDAHYLTKNERPVHKAYLNSKEGDREVDAFYEFTYLMDYDEVTTLLAHTFDGDINFAYEVVNNTLEIQNKIESYSLFHKQDIPRVEVKNYPKFAWWGVNNDYADEMRHRFPNICELFVSDDIQNRYWINQCWDKLDELDKGWVHYCETGDDRYIVELEEEARVKKVISEKLETNMFRYPNTLQHYIDLIWDCGSMVGAGRGCFLPGNLVTLSDGKVKPIENVKPGDMILTKNGLSYPVTKTLSYDCNEKIYKITVNTDTYHPIYCTDNHQFWVMRGAPCDLDRKKCSKHCIKSCRKRSSFNKEWVRADELSVYDWVFYPRPIFPSLQLSQIDLVQYIQNYDYYNIYDNYFENKQKKKPITRFIPLDEDFYYVLGVCIGDGWTTIEDNKSCLGIAFNSNTQKDLNSLQKCATYFENLGFSVTQIKHKQKNLIQLYIYSKPLAILFQSLIGKGAENKQIPQELLCNNKELMLSLLKGLLASDGSYDKNSLRISYDSINFNLISQVKELLAFLGVYASIATRPNHANCQTSYKLRAGGAQLNPFISQMPLLYQTPSHIQTNLMIEEDGFYIGIKNISTEQYQGKVYDLTVEHEHNYMVSNIVVHNSSCAALNHYLMGITQLDPIEWELPFFRYLNEERIELPDIDIDLCPSKVGLILSKIAAERSQMFNDEVPEWAKKLFGCTRIATFGTEGTKSAILTACRGYRSEDYPDGIDVDQAQYMASLIPQERGYLWSIKDVIYGNEEKNRKPVKSFIREINNYPGLLDIITGIENLVNKRSSHASGVLFFDGDPFAHCAFMKTPKGEIITQWNLHDVEFCGNTKYDFLVTEVQDKIVQTIEFLQEDGEIDPSLSLRQVYDKYLHPSILPLDDNKIWDALDNVSVINTFQFDS